MTFCDAGVATPPLGLGLAALGRPGYINLGHDADLPSKTVDEMREQAFVVLDKAWEQGVRYFDAARSYGRSEEFLAAWLASRGIPASAVVVGSKWGYTYTAGWRVDNGEEPHEVKEHTLANLEKQWPLSRDLLCPHLDLYQIHSATQASGVLRNPDVIEGLSRLKRERGVRIGLTLSGVEQGETLRQALKVKMTTPPQVPGGAGTTAEEEEDRLLFDCVQATWNVMEQSAGDALLEAREAGLEVIVKEALANGRLTRRNESPAAAATLDALKELGESFSNSHQTDVDGSGETFDVDAVALAVVMCQPFKPMTLSGATTTAQLESNAAALRLLDRLRSSSSESSEALVRRVLNVGKVEPETYWNERSALAWN